MKKNRRGEIGVQMMFSINLLLMIVIGGGIVFGASLFFGRGPDFRQAEADILNYKVRECVLEKGIDFEGGKFHEVCGFNKKVLEENNGIKICIGSDNMEECIEDGKPAFVLGGLGDFESCGFTGKKAESFAKCSFESLEKEGKVYGVLIFDNQNIRKGVG